MLLLAGNVDGVGVLEVRQVPLDPEGKMDEAGERGDDAGHEDRVADDCGCECHACIISRTA